MRDTVTSTVTMADTLRNDGIYFTEQDTTNYYLNFRQNAIVSAPQTTYVEKSETGHLGIQRFFSLEQDDGIFALLLLCFVFLAHLYKDGLVFFRENSHLIFGTRKSVNLFTKATLGDFWYNFVLVFQSILLAAIIVYAYFINKGFPLAERSSFLTIGLFIVLISFVESFKYLCYRFVGYLFDIQSSINVWLRSYMLIVEMLGLIAFIPTLLLVYADSYQDIILLLLLILFVVSRLVIFYRIILFFLQENVNSLYLITYLCSIEIIPYILLYNGLLYLYKIDIISLLWH